MSAIRKRSSAAASLGARKLKYAKKSKLGPPDLRLVRKVINEGREVKFADTVYNGVAVGWNGMTIATLTAITLGTTDQTRVGDKIKCYSMKMQYYLAASGSAYVTSARVLVVQVNQLNSGLSYSQILESAYLGTLNAPNAQYANDYKDNFKVLYDRTHMLQYVPAAGNAIVGATVRINKFPMGPVKYVAGGSNHYNGIYVLAISSEQTATPNFYGTFRLKYTDA